MELKTAIEILEYHQEWRSGKREDMIHEPKKLTQALDVVINEVKKFCLGTDIRSFEYKHLWDLMNEINTIMRESYMIEGREFGRTEGYKIMGRLEQWAEHH